MQLSHRSVGTVEVSSWARRLLKAADDPDVAAKVVDAEPTVCFDVPGWTVTIRALIVRSFAN